MNIGQIVAEITATTTGLKKAELEYRKKIDLANAKEEEKYIIELKYQTA